MIKLKDNTVALISDIHLGVHQDSHAWHNIALSFADWLDTELKKRNILDIIITGDLFHDRSDISVYTVSTAHKFFNKLKNYNIILTIGNHDCYYKDRADVNSASILSGWPNIAVVDTIQTIEQFNKKITFVPWGTSVSSLEKSDIIFGHFELNSFYHNNYKICTHGVPTTSILDKGKCIITGHFHKTEHRKYENGQILYVGSPYQQTFADVDCENGCYIFNLKTLEIEEFIINNLSPKHFKIKLSECTSGEITLTKLKKIVPNNIISFIVDKQVTPEQANLFATKLHTLNPLSLRVDFNYEASFASSSTNSDFTAVDICKTIEEFVNTLDIEFKDDVISYLIDSYKQVT